MCPTFVATSEEIMSTRGRANAIRAALELRGTRHHDPLRCEELEAALSNCLACKACTTECPSNVNLALIKAELQHARIRRDGLSLRERLFSAVDFFGRMGCAMPALTNATLPYVKALAEHGADAAMAMDAHLARGLNVYQGAITHEAVARDLGLAFRAYRPSAAHAA